MMFGDVYIAPAGGQFYTKQSLAFVLKLLHDQHWICVPDKFRDSIYSTKQQQQKFHELLFHRI